MNYLPTCKSRLVEAQLYQVSFKSVKGCRRSSDDKLGGTEWWNDVPFYGGGIIKILTVSFYFLLLVTDYNIASLNFYFFKILNLYLWKGTKEFNITLLLKFLQSISPWQFCTCTTHTFFLVSSVLSKAHFCLHCSHVVGVPHFFSELVHLWHLLPINAASMLQYSHTVGCKQSYTCIH